MRTPQRGAAAYTYAIYVITHRSGTLLWQPRLAASTMNPWELLSQDVAAQILAQLSLRDLHAASCASRALHGAGSRVRGWPRSPLAADVRLTQ